MDRRIVRTGVVGAAAALAVGALFGTGASAQKPRGLTALVADANGSSVGKVRIVPHEGDKITVRVAVNGLTPGFHGFHIHSVGVCDPAAQDTTGAPVPFFSAGGHYNPGGGTHGTHAGDLPPILVASDGTGFLKFRTDAFRGRELRDQDGSAVIIHAGPDNLGHVPAATPAGGERYHSHVDDIFGPDTATKATGDAGARAACGVIRKAG